MRVSASILGVRMSLEDLLVVMSDRKTMVRRFLSAVKRASERWKLSRPASSLSTRSSRSWDNSNGDDGREFSLPRGKSSACLGLLRVLNESLADSNVSVANTIGMSPSSCVEPCRGVAASSLLAAPVVKPLARRTSGWKLSRHCRISLLLCVGEEMSTLLATRSSVLRDFLLLFLIWLNARLAFRSPGRSKEFFTRGVGSGTGTGTGTVAAASATSRKAAPVLGMVLRLFIWP